MDTSDWSVEVVSRGESQEARLASHSCRLAVKRQTPNAPVSFPKRGGCYMAANIQTALSTFFQGRAVTCWTSVFRGRHFQKPEIAKWPLSFETLASLPPGH